MKVINLFAGPGIGKSTTAAGVFWKMKTLGFKVELVTEFAKGLVYASDMKLKDQLYVFAKQNWRLSVLEGQVDYAITDSPLILSNIYFDKETSMYTEEYFKQLVGDTFDHYHNINFVMNRDTETHPYQKYGRTQTLEEAKELDDKIMEYLTTQDIMWHDITVATAVDEIVETVRT